MDNELEKIRQSFGIKLPPKLLAALLDPSDRIHSCALLLTASDNVLLHAASVNDHLKSIEWKDWPEYLVAFATNECGDYFAFDTRQSPYKVYYVGPGDSVPEAILACEEEGFVFDCFDAWYDRRLADQSGVDKEGGEP